MNASWFYLIILLLSASMLPHEVCSAAKRPMSMSELAAYKGTDRQQILEEGAKKEKTLTLYTMGILTQGVKLTVNAFEKRYPYLKVNIWRSSGAELISRAVEEFKAGQSVVDVIEGQDVSDAVFVGNGMLQPYYSPALAYTENNAILPAPGGYSFTTGFRGSNVSLGYNTKLLSKQQIPKTYQELLDPKWKGKIAIAGGSAAKWLGVILDTFGEDFAKRLSEQSFPVHPLSGMAVLNMIVNGEYALSATIYDSHVSASKKKGAPVDWFPIEPVYSNLGTIAMSKITSHPHAALLLIDFYLSEESVAIHKKAGYSSTRSDEPARANYKRFYGPKTLEDAKRWNDTFNRLFLKK